MALPSQLTSILKLDKSIDGVGCCPGVWGGSSNSGRVISLRQSSAFGDLEWYLPTQSQLHVKLEERHLGREREREREYIKRFKATLKG